jgi:hypothetical protein
MALPDGVCARAYLRGNLSYEPLVVRNDDHPTIPRVQSRHKCVQTLQQTIERQGLCTSTTVREKWDQYTSISK